MAIIIKADFHDFKEAFRRADRLTKFSHVGLRALYEYFDDMSEESGENIELNVIAICSEFSEFVDIAELREAYMNLDLGDLTDDAFLEYLREKTTVLEYLPARTAKYPVVLAGYVVADFRSLW